MKGHRLQPEVSSLCALAAAQHGHGACGARGGERTAGGRRQRGGRQRQRRLHAHAQALRLSVAEAATQHLHGCACV